MHVFGFGKLGLFFLVLVFGLIVFVGVSLAYNPNFPNPPVPAYNPQDFGHSADEVNVQVISAGNPIIKTLQNAITDGEIVTADDIVPVPAFSCVTVSANMANCSGGQCATALCASDPFCSSGCILTGGGVSCQDPTQQLVIESYPTPVPPAVAIGWIGACTNTIAGSKTYAICCKLQ